MAPASLSPPPSPRSLQSSATRPLFHLRFWLLGWHTSTSSGPRDSEFKLRFRACVSLCVLWCFFSSPHQSVGVLSIWNGTSECQQPLLFVQLSAEMASSVTSPIPLQGNHSDEQARTPEPCFTSRGPIRSASRAAGGLAHPVLCTAVGEPHALLPGGLPVLPAPAPAAQRRCEAQPGFQEGPRVPFRHRNGPSQPSDRCLCLSCHFSCLFLSLAISPLLMTRIERNFTCNEHGSRLKRFYA